MILEMSESNKKEKIKTVVGIIAAIIIVAAIGFLIWSIFFSNNVYLIIGSIVVIAIGVIIGFFVELYEDSAYFKKKAAKSIQQVTETPIPEDSSEALFCPNCGQKLFARDAIFCANCGEKLQKD